MATLNVYTTKPLREAKAAQELREAGVRAYVPSEPRQWGRNRRYVPTGRQYVFAKGEKPYDAEHVGKRLGTATPEEVRRMYVRSSKTQRRHAFAVGDKVIIRKGHNAEVMAVICEILGRGWYSIGVDMFGKFCTSKKHERDLADPKQIRYEPG
jgi:hypothetical protein